MLNILEYALICLNKHISEYVRILNVSDALHNIGQCTNYRAVIETEAYSEHYQTFKMEHFAKRIIPECRHETRHFQGRGSLVELGHFSKHFVNNKTKKVP